MEILVYLILNRDSIKIYLTPPDSPQNPGLPAKSQLLSSTPFLWRSFSLYATLLSSSLRIITQQTLFKMPLGILEPGNGRDVRGTVVLDDLAANTGVDIGLDVSVLKHGSGKA